MYRLSGFIILLFCLNQLSAHQADLSATMLAEQEEGTWVVQITAALTAFEYEIHQRFGEDAYQNAAEFQELVRQCVLDEFNLSFNDLPPVLAQPPIVRLGHETTVLMEFKTFKEAPSRVAIQHTVFKHIGSSQSAFVIHKEGLKSKQVMLNSNNDYQATLALTDTGFTLIHTGRSSGWSRYAFVLAVVILAIIGFRQVNLLLRQVNQEPGIA